MTTQEKIILFIIAAYFIIFPILFPLIRIVYALIRGKAHLKPKFTFDNVWFPCFTWVLEWFYIRISIGYWFNKWNWLRNNIFREPAISEIYLLFFFIVGIVWIILIERQWCTFLTGSISLGIGAGFAFYRPLEILLFSLRWLFAAKGRVETYRRTLACSILNLFEISIYFTIIFLLLGWFDPLTGPESTWEALRLNVFGAFSLESFEKVSPHFMPQFFSAVRALTSWILVVMILGNVVSSISRGEKNYYPVKRCEATSRRNEKKREL